MISHVNHLSVSAVERATVFFGVSRHVSHFLLWLFKSLSFLVRQVHLDNF